MHAVPPLSAIGIAREVAGTETPHLPRRGSFYRPCVVCGEPMNRVNYGHNSGVIVDSCKEHGIWFDADQLARILTWLALVGTRHALRVCHRKRGTTGREPRLRRAIRRSSPGMHRCRRFWTS